MRWKRPGPKRTTARRWRWPGRAPKRSTWCRRAMRRCRPRSSPMLPRATHTRGEREASRGRQGGRTHEIQRLIGRALRAVVDLPALGERTIQLDCDVIQADGGTRTAAITGSFVALCDAMAWMRERSMLAAEPVRESVA